MRRVNFDRWEEDTSFSPSKYFLYIDATADIYCAADPIPSVSSAKTGYYSAILPDNTFYEIQPHEWSQFESELEDEGIPAPEIY